MNLLSQDTINGAVNRLQREWFKVSFWKNVYKNNIFLLFFYWR
jgi:hypothetical protein